MQEKLITYNQSQIHYIVYGHGSRPIIGFHGYGEDAVSFSVLETVLEEDVSLIVITLPLHGNSDWKEQDFCTAKDIISIIDNILSIEQLSSEIFSIAGYSLGGRICLKLLEIYPQRINHTLLIAPDGIKMFLLQYLATQNRFSNWLFKFTIKYPQWFLAVIKTIKFFKIVHPSIAEFVYRLMADKEERTSLYNRWMMFKYLHPDISIVKKNILGLHKKVDIIIGEYDKLIKPTTIDGLKNGIDDTHITIHKLPTGHILIKEKFAAQIASLL